MQGPLLPSASPIPVPFPSNLQVSGIYPATGPITGGITVSVLLSGVSSIDFNGFDASFVIGRWPRGPTSFSRITLQGAPKPVDGMPPVIPKNGLLNLTFTLPARGAGAPATVAVGVASQHWVDGWTTVRTAICADPVTSCNFNYIDPGTPSGTQSASGTPRPTPSSTASFTATLSPGASESVTPSSSASTGASASPVPQAPPSGPTEGHYLSTGGVVGLAFGFVGAVAIGVGATIAMQRRRADFSGSNSAGGTKSYPNRFSAGSSGGVSPGVGAVAFRSSADVSSSSAVADAAEAGGGAAGRPAANGTGPSIRVVANPVAGQTTAAALTAPFPNAYAALPGAAADAGTGAALQPVTAAQLYGPRQLTGQ